MLLLLLALGLSLAGRAQTPERVTRPDGTEVVYYLDRPSAERYPLAVILQGSECRRVSDKFESLISQLTGTGVAVVRIEKPGLTVDTAVGECPDEYLRLNTVDRRVLDLLTVLARLRREEAGWDGRLGVSGGSEGAMVAAMAAPLIPETTAVLLLSSGGGSEFGEEVKAAIAAQMRASGADESQVAEHMACVEKEWEQIERSPLPSREWASDGALGRNTYLWWNSALRVALYRPLAEVRVPIRVYEGSADQEMLPGNSQRLQERHQVTGRGNLELVTYEGGHVPPEEVLQDAFRWLGEQLTRNE